MGFLFKGFLIMQEIPKNKWFTKERLETFGTHKEIDQYLSDGVANGVFAVEIRVKKEFRIIDDKTYKRRLLRSNAKIRR